MLAAVSGLPIAGAEVRIQPPLQSFQPGTRFTPVPPVTTDRNGRFAFASLDPFSYGITVVAEGFAPQEYGSPLPGQTQQLWKLFTLDSGAAIKDVVIRMASSAAVSGRVVADGRSTSGIEVRLVKPAYGPDGRKNPRTAGAVLTDDRGEYRIHGVVPGRYYVIAGPPTYEFMSTLLQGGAWQALRAVAQRYPVTYYPSTLDLSKAVAVDIKPGSDVRDVDIAMSTQQPFRIRGRVVDGQTNQALPARVTVSWHPRDAPYGPNGTGSENTTDANPDGTSESAPLVPGKYWLEVKARSTSPQRGVTSTAADRQPLSQAAIAVEVIASDVDNVVVRMMPSTTLRGRITLDGQPLTTMAGMERVQVSVSSIVVGAIALIAPPQPTPRQPDGTFQFERIAPGDYRLRFALLPQGVYVKQATLGALDVLSEGLRVPNNTTDILEIVLSAKGGQLEGAVTDDAGSPLDNVQAVLIPEATNLVDLYRTANTDDKGFFTMRGITPGDYRVFAWEALDANMYFDPEVVRPVLDRGTRVRVTEASKVTAAVKVIPAER